MLPKRQGLSLNEANIKRIGEATLDYRRANQGRLSSCTFARCGLIARIGFPGRRQEPSEWFHDMWSPALRL